MLVDAFAGEGADEAGRPGSPLIMVDAALAGIESLRSHREPPKIDVVLIEHARGRRTRLAANLARYGAGITDMVEVRDATLAAHLDEILTRSGDAPMLVFLDPFGVKGLSAELVHRTLSGQQREVLVQFNPTAAQRLGHAAVAEVPRRENVHRARAAQTDLFVLGPDIAAICAGDIAKSRASLESVRRGANEQLRALFGHDEWRPLLQRLSAAQQARASTIDLFEEALRAAGARYVTRMPIYNDACRLQYVLLHASKHAVGRQAIKEAYCRAVDTAELPLEARRQMQARVVVPREQVESALAQFAGEEVAWAKNRPGSLQAHLLRETGVFPWQIASVEALLCGLHWRVPGRQKRFRIPAELPGWIREQAPEPGDEFRRPELS